MISSGIYFLGWLAVWSFSLLCGAVILSMPWVVAWEMYKGEPMANEMTPMAALVGIPLEIVVGLGLLAKYLESIGW